MCGIAGFSGSSLTEEKAEKSCRRMQAALRHRGPDAEGLFHDAKNGVHLVHTRLSIIDTDDRSNQPLHRTGRYSIVFNGEIYNFFKLREELERDGAIFATRSDTEVILALYEHQGIAGFSRLRGMYAFGIWDSSERLLILARDAFGIKPLYYAETNDGLVFGSEVRTLLASGLVKTAISAAGASAFFKWGSCPQDNLPLEGIRALEPGAILLHHPGKKNQIVQGKAPPSEAPENPGIQDFRSILLDSVSHHLVSDVPPGLFLSGGLDSAALLAASTLGGHARLHTFTLGFPDSSMDESLAARELARDFGSIHVENIIPDDTALAAVFDAFLSIQDLPSIDGFNTYCVSALAKQSGVKVVLSGLGGDELLGGYPSFKNVPRLRRTGEIFNRVPFARKTASLGATVLHGRWARCAEFLAGPARLERAYAAYRSLFSQKEVDALMRRLEIPPAFPEERRLGPGLDDGQRAISQLELTIYLRNQLLRDSDACGMAHGVEIRVPFLDVPLWQTAGNLPDSLRYLPGKKILKAAFPELPDGLFNRPKKGFSLPYDQWRQNALHPFFGDVSRNTGHVAQSWYQQMAWIAWQRWRKQCGV